jgi:hypothetical protein
MSLPALISVFGIAFFSLWASIPAGIALGQPVVAVILTAALSYAAGVGLIVVIGQPLRERILKRFGGKNAGDPNSRIRRIWDRYGLVGLALVSPMTVGAHFGAIIGLSLNAPPRRLFVLMSLGGLLSSTIFALLISLGVAAVQR